MNESFYAIGGITYKVSWNHWLPSLLSDRFQNFRIHDIDANPDIQFFFYEIKTNLFVSNTTPPLTFFSEEMKEILYTLFLNEKSCSTIDALKKSFRQSDANRDDQYFYAEEHILFLADFNTSCIYIFFTSKYGDFFPEYKRFLPQYHVKANFRNFFSIFLPRFEAVMLHSAGVKINDKTALFLGVDGGGKTTIVSSLNQGEIYNDDQVLIRKQPDGYGMYSTPFGRISNQVSPSVINGLFVLNQSDTFRLEKGNAKELVRLLWNEHINRLFFLPKTLKIKTFTLLSDICHSAPVYILHFPKEGPCWKTIEAALKE